MFGKSAPVVIDTYSSRRGRRKFPRWLLVLVFGLAAGAAGVIYVQERHLPPRLTIDASARLRDAFADADWQRQRLAAELAETSKNLDAALADRKALTDELETLRRTADGLRGQIGLLVDALPPDPRGGEIEVRAARFSADGGALAYDVVLTREKAGGKPLSGVMQLTVAGNTSGGSESSITLPPVAVSVGRFQSLNGSLPLPAGFTPRQSTIHVRDRVDGKLLGMRVMYVR